METAEFAELSRFDPAVASRAELETAMEKFGRLEGLAAAGQFLCLVAIDALDDGGVAAADVARARTKCSARRAKRAAKTATQLAKMPRTAAALARGDINAEHADAAADAAERTSPEEADELAGDAAAQPADRFRRQSREWANTKESDADRAARHERQRRDRSGSVFTGDDGMTVLHARFDPVTGQSVENAVDREVDRLWRADGGRDGTPNDVRTPEQRRADAIAGLLTQTASSTERPHPKYLAVVRVDADRCRGDDPTGVAEFVDGTPIPQPVLERLACDAEWVGAVYDGDGAVLWQGRRKRLATDDQWAALVARDGGCFCCDAPPAYCEAHHLTFWEDHGHTNIDEMLLVCTNTHHLVHDHGWTIQQANDKWVLRRPGVGRAPPSEQAA